MVKVRLRRNKKASLQDIIFIGAALLGFAIVTLIVFKLSSEMKIKFEDNPTINSTTRAIDSFSRINELYPTVIDNAFLYLTVGLAIVSLVLVSMVRIHPIFFIFFLFLFIIVIILCGVFSNIYQKIAMQPDMADIAAKLVFTSHIMEFLPFILGILGFLLAIIMYKAWSNEV